MSLSAQKPSKTRRRNGERTSIEILFELMNDETLPRMERQRIAVKLAPYFHPKLKRLRPGQVPYDYPFSRDDPTDNLDAESDAQQRERIRKRLFERFD
jgi:hypothetical protein